MKSDQLAVLCPSRGRRKVFDALLASFDATHSGHAHILLRNGERDADLATYNDLSHPHVTRVVGTDDGFDGWPTAGYCFAMQDLYARNPGYAAYSMMEDDCTFLDAGWDATILAMFNQFPNRIGLVQWQVDGITVLAASREWCSALGYFMLRELREHGYQGLLALSPACRATGPRLAHSPQPRGKYRNDHGHAAMDPEVLKLYREDYARHAEWVASDRYAADLARIQTAAMVPA